MNAKKQHGKGLSGFFIGLLLATAVIAGVLFFLNKNGQSSMKELPKPEEKAPKPEILVPPGASSHSSEPTSEPKSETVTSPASNEKHSEDTDQQPNKASGGDNTAFEEQQVIDGQSSQETTMLPVPPKVPTEESRAVKEARRQALIKKQAEIKKAEAERIRKQAESKTKQEAKINPTPEQILDSGSVEKARQEARKRAADDAEHKRAEDVLNGRSGFGEKQGSKPVSSNRQSPVTENTSSNKGGKVIVQIGSYNNQQAADVQRSKLAMAGVSANVVQAEVNGSTIYRVQTSVLSASEATVTQKKLQQRGIASFARSVK
ncbi:MAG: SPOR domain-containing protein [Neisseria sp.]|uniref:SPOR domain-containing protein n=1 Tax=Neisseria sp. TaxID=192066 RepID=UPI0026DCBC91|nr:SPOR domain-containing protein [Neisseria sp.]MDO4641587.1 SPOR domain-containing protein [Neisseria sp.]